MALQLSRADKKKQRLYPHQQGTCKEKDCSQRVFSRGWCSAHYKRWYRHGDPQAGGTSRRFTEVCSAPVEIRLRHMLSVDAKSNCWVWHGEVNSNGYGRLRHHGKRWLAHRLAFTVWNTPIPIGLQVNHTCDNRLCLNPQHLWLGTQSENIKDAILKGRVKTPRFSGKSRSPNSDRSVEEVDSESGAGSRKDSDRASFLPDKLL